MVAWTAVTSPRCTQSHCRPSTAPFPLTWTSVLRAPGGSQPHISLQRRCRGPAVPTVSAEPVSQLGSLGSPSPLQPRGALSLLPAAAPAPALPFSGALRGCRARAQPSVPWDQGEQSSGGVRGLPLTTAVCALTCSTPGFISPLHLQNATKALKCLPLWKPKGLSSSPSLLWNLWSILDFHKVASQVLLCLRSATELYWNSETGAGEIGNPNEICRLDFILSKDFSLSKGINWPEF